MKAIRVTSHILGIRQYVCTTPNGPYRLLSIHDRSAIGRIRIIEPAEESNGILQAIMASYRGPGRKVELVDLPEAMWPRPACDHMLGLAYVLNDGEGDAWVRRWVRKSDGAIDAGDWLKVFRHCPVCGAVLPKVEGAETVLVTGAAPEVD